MKRHVIECSDCMKALAAADAETRAFFEGLEVERSEGGEHSLESYSNVIDGVLEKLSAEGSRLDVERRSAPDLLDEIEGLDHAKQVLVIRNSPRFQAWGLAEYVLEQSRRLWTEDPRRAEDLALLAFRIIEEIDEEGFRRRLLNDLKAEAWSYAGNARRIQSDLRGSAEAFAQAEHYLGEGTRDQFERAQLLSLKASYLREIHDFAQAVSVLDEVIATYREADERHLEGKALLSLAKVKSDAGSGAEECLPILERASTLLEDADPWLSLVAMMQRLFNLTEAGRGSEAQAILPEVRALAHQSGNRLDRLRLLWIEGLICRDLGKVELAEEALKQVREGFIATEIGYDVALVSLDLASLYLEAGRTVEVKELAAEMLPQFAARQIQREALAAISLFEQAARQERATVSLVRQVASTVKDVRSRKGTTGQS